MGPYGILIAEDDTVIARELAVRLAGFGYEVTGIVGSGAEAVTATSHARPDVVLMNVALAGAIDSLTAAEEIRRRWQVPTVFLVPADDHPLLTRATVPEPFGYVVKPYTNRELRMNLGMALHEQRMKAQAHEWEDRFFAVSIDMLCFLDFSGYFKRLNPAWERTLGFTCQELMSKPFIEFVHPDDRERTLQQNKEVRGGGQARAFENRYLCKDGSYRWFLWNAAPDIDHRVIYSVARDITERKRAEDERETLVRELKAALAEVKRLQAILPICSYCKKIRDDENYWQTVEAYFSQHTSTRFSHSVCPACYKKELEPQFAALEPK